MLEIIYYLALLLIAIFIAGGFVYAWCRRSPLVFTFTVSGMVICLAFHFLESSAAIGKDELYSVPRDFSQCAFLDQQPPEVSNLGYPIVELMCDDGLQTVDASIYNEQLKKLQACSPDAEEASCQ